MRTSTLFSLLATSLALFSQSPITFAAPVPSPVDLVGAKRCLGAGCRIAEPTNTTSTTSQSTDLRLAAALIAALQEYQNQYGASSPNPIAITTSSDPSGQPADDPTTDGSPAVAVAELLGGAL